MVVTATRTDNSMLNTPVRVNLISPRQLGNIPVQNIDEALKYAPGINYNRPFGIFSTKANVMMRGLSGKEQGRVLVLLDGVPLNKSDGGTVDWNLVDVNSVKKIEISSPWSEVECRRCHKPEKRQKQLLLAGEFLF